MTSPRTLRTPYEHRLEIVASTIVAHSSLDGDAAAQLAVQVLVALSSIPEKVR